MTFEADIVAARPGLLRYGRKLARSRDSGEDLAQEAIARALANREKFTEGSDLSAWLAKILLNACRNDIRKRVGPQAGDNDELKRFHPATQDVVVQIGDALRSLPPKLRDALWLLATGHGVDDAAARLGVPEGTVKTRVFRAREQLNRQPKWNPRGRKDFS